MKWLHKLIGFVMSSATRDDFINAQIEDKAREHSDIVGALHAAFFRRRLSNDALRESIRIAKERTNSFEDFERMAHIRQQESVRK